MCYIGVPLVYICGTLEQCKKIPRGETSSECKVLNPYAGSILDYKKLIVGFALRFISISSLDVILTHRFDNGFMSKFGLYCQVRPLTKTISGDAE
jgi:hypothetical protein